MVWTVRKVDVDPSHKFWAAGGGSSKKIIFSTFFGQKNKKLYKVQGWSGVLPWAFRSTGATLPRRQGHLQGCFSEPHLSKNVPNWAQNPNSNAITPGPCDVNILDPFDEKNSIWGLPCISTDVLGSLNMVIFYHWGGLNWFKLIRDPPRPLQTP